jgi:hypothetical protein
VFSGKEATLNRVIMLVLRSSKKPLAKYDVYLQVHGVKGLRHVDSKSVYRRMDALDCEGWIAQNGTRPAKVRGESVLYELALKGKAALRLDDVSIECFLERATGEQLVQFIGLFSDDLKV